MLGSSVGCSKGGGLFWLPVDASGNGSLGWVPAKMCPRSGDLPSLSSPTHVKCHVQEAL